MKKISAFSVFQSKKGDTPKAEKENVRVPMKKAASEPSINSEGKKSKRILKALKGGSISGRSTKARPSVLANGSGDSPFVAGDKTEVKLTAVKSNKVDTPKLPPNTTRRGLKKKTPPKTASNTSVPISVSELNSSSNTSHSTLSSLSSGDMVLSPQNLPYQNTLPPVHQASIQLGLPRASVQLGMPVQHPSYIGYAADRQPFTQKLKKTPPKSKVNTQTTLDDENEAMNLHENSGERPLVSILKSRGPDMPESAMVNGTDEGMQLVNSNGLPAAAKPKLKPKPKSLQQAGKKPNRSPPSTLERMSETPETSTQKRKLSDLEEANSSLKYKKRKMTEIPQPTPEAGASNAMLPGVYDSAEEAERVFDCLIHPVKKDKFFRELWERKPLLVKRHIPKYNAGWFSTEEFDQILRKENIQFTVNLDVTSYVDGKRETYNPVGRAYAPIVWDYYQNGCSVRLLNPQTFSENVRHYLSMLQEFFGCMAGANVYLTPPGTQGFAPHYDDIEAFILQLEGKKHWRLYNPRSEMETLPRYSSENFTEDDIGEPILDVVLEPGDLLYFPRGTIHQANALEEAHSLHLTVSCYQKNSWGDLLEKIVPRALEIAIEEDVEFRQGLPRNFLQYMGVAHSDVENTDRKRFLGKVSQLLKKLLTTYTPIDAACDQMGKKFIHDSLPPVLSEEELACSVLGTGERWDQQRQQVVGTVEMEPDTAIKIVRRGVLRLLTENDQVRVYHSLENSKVYHGAEPQFIEIEAEVAPAVEYLIHAYPHYVTVDNLPLQDISDKISIATALYEKGLLITGEPLEPLEDTNSNDGEK